MNIFPPEDCSWFKCLVGQKRVISIAFFVLVNISNLFAQLSDEVQMSENYTIQGHPTTAERALKRFAHSIKSDAKSNFRNALKLAKLHNWTLQKVLSDGRVLSLQGVDEFNNPIYYITHSQVSPSACTRTNSLYYGGSLGVSLNGSTTIVKDKLGLWDGGLVRASHQEFAINRIKQIDAPNYFNEHATHTAGILVGAGVNKQARGMAFGGNLKAWDFSDDISEMAFAAKGLLVSNHSYGVLAGWVLNPDRSGIIGRDDNLKWEWWGDSTISKSEDYRFGFYDKKSSDLDKIAYNAPYYLIVKSADNKRNENGPTAGTAYYLRNTNTKSTVSRNRNDSFDTIPMDGNAKNILTVGAIDGGEVVPTKPSEIKMSAYSSWGPTDDGRIKPDLVGVGEGIFSASANGDDVYATYNGTSVASPNVAGSLLLLQEFYAKQKYGYTMRASTLKGIALHTANEAGTTQGPDYQFGWGLLNMERAAQVIANSDQNHFLSESLLYQNSTNSFQIIASGKSPIKATISWTDPESTPTEVKPENLNNRTPKLINDLDIRVSDGQKTFMPWVLNPNAPSLGAMQGDNFRDNVEQVYIENPVAGKIYTITVNHKSTFLKGDIQYYALIVSGISSVPCQGVASIASSGNTSLCKGAVKLITNSGTNLSYAWNWNGQKIPLSNNASYTAKVAGNYSVTITQGKCSATSPNIVVENAQTPVISTDNGNNICTANINLSVKNLTATGTTFQWQKDKINISKATDAILNVSESGNYTITTTQNKCSATSLAFVITNIGGSISTNPVPGKYLLRSGRTQPIQVVPIDSKKYDFQWFKDGIAVANSNQNILNINDGGKYFVKASSGKCTAISGIVEFVKLSGARERNFEENEKQEGIERLILSPNPTNEYLKIQYFTKENNHSEPYVEIINSLGTSILLEKLEKDYDNLFTKTIDVNSIHVGMYFVRIIDGDRFLIKKFIRN